MYHFSFWLGFISQLSIVWAILSVTSQQYSANIRANFILPETMISQLHVTAAIMGLLLFKFVRWTPKHTCNIACNRHSRSSKVVGLGTECVCNFLLLISCNFEPTSHRFEGTKI